MHLLILFYIVIFGMILGSFLGLAVVRIPAGESLFSPRSHCRSCRHILAWYENIPILSYLFLWGKCRACGSRISPRYIIIEVLTTLVTVFSFYLLEPWPRFLLYEILFIAPMLLLLFLDWEAMILPDFITIPGIAAGFLVHWLDGQYFLPYQFGVTGQKLFMESLLGALAGSVTLFLLAFLYQKIRHRPGLGGGDVKMGAMIGAFFGWKDVFFIFFMASVLGTAFGILLILIKRASRDTPLPFGTFLAATALLYLFFGDFLLKTYLGLVGH